MATNRTTLKPVDLDADDVYDLDALHVEATRKPFRFKFGGEQFEMPGIIDIRALALLDVGNLHGFLSTVLGPDQWERLINVKAVLGPEHFEDLLGRYMGHLGLDLGKLLVSTGSSKSTGVPSKRTSPGTTGSRSRTSRTVR